MKKLWTLMAMVAVFASCSQEETDSPLNTYTLTGYADVESRTAFGTPGTNKIPFQWSAGDYIYNGTNKSNALSNGGSSADFTFSGTSSSSDVYYNISGTSSATQAYVQTNQTVGNLGENGDFGYGTISNGSFKLKHATSYLWFDVTSSHNSSVTLQSVKVSADVNIAGKATWDGTSLGSVSEGKTSIELTVGQALSSTNNNVWAMVVLPNLANQSFKVTYKLKVGNNTKYYTETITGKQNFISGTTQKVSLKITNNTPLTDYAELRVLTFEDEDAKFDKYTLDYCNAEIATWSDLIAGKQYGDELIYDMSGTGPYYWYDQNNTELYHAFPYNYGSYMYWGGGHAISNFANTDYVTYGNYNYQLMVYGEEGQGGNNGSANFAMHYGYIDGHPTNQTEELSSIGFYDDKERVIDHMYINLSCYILNCLVNGNDLTGKLTEVDSMYITATGFDAEGNKTGESTFYLAQNGQILVTEWTKWDLSELGAVAIVYFNVGGTNQNKDGFSQPAYFAYDDVAVQFTE